MLFLADWKEVLRLQLALRMHMFERHELRMNGEPVYVDSTDEVSSNNRFISLVDRMARFIHLQQEIHSEPPQDLIGSFD